MLRNTEHTYGWVSILLHWTMALLMIGMFALGLFMVDLDYYDPWYNKAPSLHESTGILLFFLLLLRFYWRLTNPLPGLPGKPWEKAAAHITHRSHYAFMFTIMITGYLIPTAKGQGITVFSWFTLPSLNGFFGLHDYTTDLIGQIHWGAAWGMIVLTGIHSAAALKHHFIDRDHTLLRMLGK